MESPTPSSCHSSQDLGRPRKAAASYRLFPTVEPTPPASPVTLKRDSLRRASGAYRRRSSSVEKGLKEASASASHTTSQPSRSSSTSTTSLRDSRKVSLPDIKTLQSVREVDSAAATPSPGSFDRRNLVCAASDHIRTASAPERSPTSDGSGRAAIGNARYGEGTVISVSGDLARSSAPMTSNLSSPSSGGHLRSRRSKPNLRITVKKDSVEQRPPPPPKSPRHYQKEADHAEVSPVTQGRRSSIDRAPVSPLVHQSFDVASPTRARLNLWPKMFARAEHAGLQSPNGYGSSQARPSTAGVLDSTFSTRSATHLPLEATKNHVKSPSKLSRGELRSYQSADRLRTERRLESPGITPYVSMEGDHDPDRTPQATSQHDVRPIVRTPAADDRDSIAAAIRKHSRVPNGAQKRQVADEVTATESLMRPDVKSALAIARANVAALRNSSSTTDSLGMTSSKERFSGAELGLLNRAFTAEALTRSASASGDNDPVATLKDLSQQCDALHTRYAGLRMERQRMSSGLIEKLKEQRTDPEHLSALLNDQLSLASVSSSMDICFTKLKSLECRKEDAIAALIAQATHETTKSPTDNISAIIASMSIEPRKSSVTPSAESESQYALTGRSTPDSRRDTYFANRSTQSSFPRTLSYTSETASLEQRLSRPLSSRNEALPQQMDQAPETIPEASEIPQYATQTQSHEGAHQEPILSPTRYTPPPSSLGMYETRVPSRIDNRPLSELFNSTEDVSETPKRNHAPGSKAAKVLGLFAKDDREARLRLELAALSTIGHQATNVSAELPLKISKPGNGVPLQPLNTITTTTTTTHDVESPIITDLTAQLENFPKPVAPLTQRRGKPQKKLPIVAPLAANPPTPVASTFGERYTNEEEDIPEVPIRPPRRDSLQQSNANKIVKRTMTQGSTRTTHTIQVFIEQDDLEILDLYRRGSAGRIAAAAEAVHVS